MTNVGEFQVLVDFQCVGHLTVPAPAVLVPAIFMIPRSILLLTQACLPSILKAGWLVLLKDQQLLCLAYVQPEWSE